MPTLEALAPAGSPRPMGAYSPALKCGNMLFLSGQIAFDANGAVIAGDIAAQTDLVMRNIGKLLEAAGATYANIVRTTVFLADMDDFAGMNDVYARYVSTPPPARSTVQVARLPRDARVEIDVIAVLA